MPSCFVYWMNNIICEKVTVASSLLRVTLAMASTDPEVEIEDSSPSKGAMPQFEGSVQNMEAQLSSERGRFCKPKYKVRKFSSKAALLVLIWNIVTNTMFGSLDSLITFFDNHDDESSYYQPVTNVIPFILLLLSALLSGWLADAYLGHYRTAKIGFILIFCLSCVAVSVSGSHGIIQ